MNKIKSGVYGLNNLLDGGINQNSTTVVIGASGAGKTTFATQYIRRGLEVGHDGIFVSLDENQEQIIREAIEMGWTNIQKYIDDHKLVFIDASGKKFAEFIREELPDFVRKWHGVQSRIVIDPLTPVIWSSRNKYEQRELLGLLMKETRRVGTVLCTLEEHGTMGDLSGPETIIPMYLADCVIHLKYTRGNSELRLLEIIKCRNSRHSHEAHKYSILRGFGVVVQKSPRKLGATQNISKKLKIELKQNAGAIPSNIFDRFDEAFDTLRDEDFEIIDPKQIIADIIEEYENEK